MSTMTITAGLSPRRRFRNDAVLAVFQVLYEQRSFWRNRTLAFFSFLLPLMFLVIFATIDRRGTIGGRGGIAADVFVVPGLLAYGVIMATFNNLAVGLASARESGVLKRVRGTPLPVWALLTGKIGSAVITAGALATVTLTVARLGYGVHIRPQTLPGLASALIVGTACFSALGIGINRLIPNADAAAAIANAAILPLTFFSGVWFPSGVPTWLGRAAGLFPVKHLANALQVAFDPRTTGAGIVARDLAVLAIWATVGALAGVWFLRHERARD